jgi:hypothetical protein
MKLITAILHTQLSVAHNFGRHCLNAASMMFTLSSVFLKSLKNAWIIVAGIILTQPCRNEA